MQQFCLYNRPRPLSVPSVQPPVRPARSPSASGHGVVWGNAGPGKARRSGWRGVCGAGAALEPHVAQVLIKMAGRGVQAARWGGGGNQPERIWEAGKYAVQMAGTRAVRLNVSQMAYGGGAALPCRQNVCACHSVVRHMHGAPQKR